MNTDTSKHPQTLLRAILDLIGETARFARAIPRLRREARHCAARFSQVRVKQDRITEEARRATALRAPELYFCPIVAGRLEKCRRRIARCGALRERLDQLHDELAALNPALSATPAGKAWDTVASRASVLREHTQREIAALLDGHNEDADEFHRMADELSGEIERHLSSLGAAMEDL